MPKPAVLLILDGWGYRSDPAGNAIKQAHTPHWDRLLRGNPWTLLDCMGVAAGLAPGQMGNSEVGHLNLGAGRRVIQPLARIDQMVARGEFITHPALARILTETAEAGTVLHLIGLLSDGGVHSHIAHLFALLEAAAALGVKRVAVHAVLDGRDTGPYSSKSFLHGLLRHLADYPGEARIATVCGRYYAMDRDRRWDRVEQAYRAIVEAQAAAVPDVMEQVTALHNSGETDEFIRPFCVAPEGGGGAPPMSPDDTVICYNFREDRARELSRALYMPDFDAFARPFTVKRFFSFSRYHEDFDNPVLLEEKPLEDTITEHLSAKGLTVGKVAETEKYAHVTYFFNGGREEPFEHERRILIPSPKVATYDLKPEMSVLRVTSAAIDLITSDQCFFTVVNFANGDMVGHTGDMDAAVKACEAVDASLGRIIDAVDGGSSAFLIVTADHGNVEKMRDSSGNIYTAHTISPVPLAVMGTMRQLRNPYQEPPEDVFADTHGQALRDVVPTILDLWSMEQPKIMDGHSLLVN